jgi:hypothetical protein
MCSFNGLELLALEGKIMDWQVILSFVRAVFTEPVVVPSAETGGSVTIPTAELAPEAEIDRALGLVVSAVEDDPVEDGFAHPAERTLTDFLVRHGAAPLYRVLFEGAMKPPILASMIRLLGREKPSDTYFRTCILRQGLRSPSVEVRDAAVQAAELWADLDSLRCLREQREATPWLADYIKKVIRDLES